MSNPKVYSYLRFSDPKQASGSSADRQLAYAQKWAADRGMALDEALSLRDEGLSAYHQRHVKQGALGAFLLAVDEGKIASGSVLVVEGLDRLSRAEPIQAQAQLAQIINAGITVVTASDNKEYNRERLKSNPMDLVYSLLVIIRAHEESDTKSKRVKAAIRRQCIAWQAGTYRGIIRNGRDPAWVRWTGDRFELEPERAELMRNAIALFLDGHGGYRVMRGLVANGASKNILPTGASTFYKILKRPDLIGTRILTIDGEEFALENYYPRLISDEDYARLQADNADRVRRKGKGEIPSVLTGLGITHCGYCGGAIVSQNAMRRAKKKDGSLQDGHRRLLCANNSLGIGCDVGGSVSVVPIEKALLAFCADQFNLSSLHSGGDQSAGARAALARAKKRIAEINRQLERVTAAMLADDDATPIAFVRKARELETQLAEAKREETIAEGEVSRLSHRQTPAVADAWKALVNGVLALDYDARMRARQLVADTFERIVIYHHGTAADGGNSAPIDLVLLAKGGVPRMLQIDRKSGAWLAMEQRQS